MKCKIKITSPAPRFAISSLSTLTRAILSANLEKGYFRQKDFTCTIFYDRVSDAKKSLKLAWQSLKSEHSVSGYDSLSRNFEMLIYDAATAELIK